jgi:hypothetical protein
LDSHSILYSDLIFGLLAESKGSASAMATNDGRARND